MLVETKMIIEPLNSIQSIQEAVKQDPSLRVFLAKKYLALGGTLTNGAIPLPYKEDIPAGYTKTSNGVYQPTVVSSAKINEEVIPDLNERLKNMSQTGIFVDSNGVERYADQTPKPEKDESAEFLKNLADFNRKFGRQPNDTTGIKKVSGGGIDTTNAYDEQGGVIGGTRKPTPQEEKNDEVYQSNINLIDRMMARTDARTKTQIEEIKNRFELRRQQMEEINRRQKRGLEQTLLMSGSSRYTESAGGVILAKENDSLMKIAELDAQEKELVDAALSAQETGDFKLLEKKLDLVETKRKEKQKETETLSKAIADENKRLREEAKETREQAEFLQEQNKKTVENIGRSVLNSLTGDETKDTVIIKGFADAYNVDANFLLNEILKQDQEKTKKELLTKEIGGSLYTYNPKTQKWELAIQTTDETKELQRESLRLDIEKKKQELKNIKGVQELSVDDPIFYVVAGIKSELGKNNAIKRYTGMIKEGKTKEAEKFVDTLAFQNLGAPQKEDYGVYSDGERIINNVLADAKKFKENNLSLYKTAVERAKPFLSLQKDQKWVDITSKIEQAQARIRKGFFGTALTGTEKASAEQFLINFDRDDIATAETKLRNMKELATDIKTRLLNEQKGIFEEERKSIKIKNLKTGEEDDYFGDLTPEEAKQAGYEIIK